MAKSRTCPSCSTRNPTTAQFCGTCGASLLLPTRSKRGCLLALVIVVALLLCAAGLIALTLANEAWADTVVGAVERYLPVAGRPSGVATAAATSETEAVLAGGDAEESSLVIVENDASPTATSTPVPSQTPSLTPPPTATATEIASATPAATATAPPTPSPTVGPSFSEILFCMNECRTDGANAQTTFPGATTRLYVRWTYENIPIGAHYERMWFNNDRLWAHYDCTWPGPTSGVDLITLTDPDGLHSGTWEMQIRIDNRLVVQQHITLTGNHVSWDPPGEFDSCYGKK